MSDDKTKKLTQKERYINDLRLQLLDEGKSKEEIDKIIKDILNQKPKNLEDLNLQEAEKKDKKPKKNPIGADLLYAKKGGMVSKKKSKVAGRLALRGYGRALKGKK